MKKRFIIVAFIISALLLLLPACSTEQSDTADNSPDTVTVSNFAGDKSGSLKTITKPYIGEYECVSARLGERNLLEKYDYITINLVNDKKMEVSFKPKNGKKKTFEGFYEVNPDTREFTGEIGILGVNFKEKTKIENGKFTITKLIFSMPLIMNFKMK